MSNVDEYIERVVCLSFEMEIDICKYTKEILNLLFKCFLNRKNVFWMSAFYSYHPYSKHTWHKPRADLGFKKNYYQRKEPNLMDEKINK